jgi:predicted metal-dependent peptidase
MNEAVHRARWRLILGEDLGLGSCLSAADQRRDRMLQFLYGREGKGRNTGNPTDAPRGADLSDSVLSVPDWINQIHELFPQRTIERLEKDAIERYKIDEVVTNPEVLARAEPNQTLLEAVLRTKHLMNQEVLAVARQLVRRVVAQLMEKLAVTVRQPFTGPRVRRRSFVKVAKNFDWRTTIRRNLANWDRDRQKLGLQTPYFLTRTRRRVDRWQFIIVVDQSGSMVSSVIHSAITASIFRTLPSIRTHLIAFDTNVIDLTADCEDPVETLMKVQLGGGTDIGRAMEYASSLVENPRRTIIVLITDFFEGAPLQNLLRVTQRLKEGGAHLLGLAALDNQAEPAYDRETAKRLVELGMHVAAMTPGGLANWVAEKIN